MVACDEARYARLVDTHCHLDLYSDPSAVLRRIAEQRIETIAVTNAPFVFQACQELVEGCPQARPALGLHPQLVSRYSAQRTQLGELLPRTAFVGEIGLDYTTQDQAERRLQRAVFDEILEYCYATGDKVLTVHSRRASREVLDAVGVSPEASVILHWFSGSVKEVERGLAAGLFYSVNRAMIRSAHGRRLVAAMDPTRLLTETDGPLAQHDGTPAEPPEVREVLSYLSGIWSVSWSDAARQVWANYQNMLIRTGELGARDDIKASRQSNQRGRRLQGD